MEQKSKKIVFAEKLTKLNTKFAPNYNPFKFYTIRKNILDKKIDEIVNRTEKNKNKKNINQKQTKIKYKTKKY